MTPQVPKFSPNYRLCLIDSTATLADAIKSINESGLMLCCIVDSSSKLVGLLTDSDLRRLMLKSVSLSTVAAEVCNRSPLVCKEDLTPEGLKELAEQEGKREIPLVDSEGLVSDIFVLGIAEKRSLGYGSQLSKPAPSIDAEMFVLAGGLGTRLRSVVSDRPKPLAEVGDSTIIDHVIQHALSCGIKKFYFSLNYKAEMIETHICSKYRGVFDYEYVKESKRLGTAGPLSLVVGEIKKPLFVVNADLLTDLDYRSVYNFHMDRSASMSIVVRRHTVSLPYGEVVLDDAAVSNILEKPDKHYLINAGIYLLNPSVLSCLEYDEHLDMPDLIARNIASRHPVLPFFMHENWIDIGKPEDYAKARESIGSR